jgi:hypothetical protein
MHVASATSSRGKGVISVASLITTGEPVQKMQLQYKIRYIYLLSDLIGVVLG